MRNLVDGAADGGASTGGRADSEARDELDSTQWTPRNGGQMTVKRSISFA